MPKRKVVQTVIVYRDGSRIVPKIGEIFDFTEQELSDINSVNPEAVTRPIVQVDIEELEREKALKREADAKAAQDAEEKAKADAEAAKAAEAKAKADAEAAKGKGKGKASDDDI